MDLGQWQFRPFAGSRRVSTGLLVAAAVLAGCGGGGSGAEVAAKPAPAPSAPSAESADAASAFDAVAPPPASNSAAAPAPAGSAPIPVVLPASQTALMPAPPPAAQQSPAQVSSSGTTITNTSGGEIVDADHRVWTLSPDGVVAVDGQPDARTAGVVLLLWHEGALYQRIEDGRWWRRSGDGWEALGVNGDPRTRSGINLVLMRNLLSRLSGNAVVMCPDGSRYVELNDREFVFGTERHPLDAIVDIELRSGFDSSASLTVGMAAILNFGGDKKYQLAFPLPPDAQWPQLITQTRLGSLSLLGTGMHGQQVTLQRCDGLTPSAWGSYDGRHRQFLYDTVPFKQQYPATILSCRYVIGGNAVVYESNYLIHAKDSDVLFADTARGPIASPRSSGSSEPFVKPAPPDYPLHNAYQQAVVSRSSITFYRGDSITSGSVATLTVNDRDEITAFTLTTRRTRFSCPAPSQGAGHVPSPDGSSIGSTDFFTTGEQLVDDNLDLWTVHGGVVHRNGRAQENTANVVLLLWYGGSIHQQIADGRWWRWTGIGWEGRGHDDPRS
jgi:hypothetical protein